MKGSGHLILARRGVGKIWSVNQRKNYTPPLECVKILTPLQAHILYIPKLNSFFMKTVFLYHLLKMFTNDA